MWVKKQLSMKNYITESGAQKLKEELKKLLTLDRPELVKVISWAASNGDRSENGDYIYGKRKLREMDRRIRFLSQRLQAAEVINPASLDHSRAHFGARVKVKDEEDKVRIYQIVGQDEIDAANGHVSWVSPIGKALLNSRKGDVVQVTSPKGTEEFEVIDILY